MAARSESTFAASLPLQAAPSEVRERLRTMVVDDSDTFLQVTCHLLDREDAIDLVAAASDSIEALDTVLRLRPALVLMDANMSGLDGLATSSLLAGMSPAPIVVLMSSDDTPQLRTACKHSGAFDFVSKANFRNELESVLQRIFRMRSAARESA